MFVQSLLKSEAAGRRTVLPVSDHELSKTYQVSASQEAPPPGAKPPKSAAVSTFSPPKAPRLEKGHTHVEYPHPNPEPYNPPVQIVAKEKDRSVSIITVYDAENLMNVFQNSRTNQVKD